MTDASLNRDSKSHRPPAVAGRFRLKISTDKLAVYMDGLQPPADGGAPVKSKQVYDKLKKLEIVYGIDGERIDEILAALNEGRLPIPDHADPESGKITGQNDEGDNSFCIAKGDAPIHGRNAALQWHIGEDKLQDYAVLPGELIATYIPPGAAKAGKGIFGKELRAQAGRDDTVKPGDGIDCVAIGGGTEYRARWFGTIRMKDDAISVTLPLSISSDRMRATMDLAPPSANKQTLDVSHILTTLQQLNITFGIKEDKLPAILATLRVSERPITRVVIAQGTSAVHGTDARISWKIAESEITGRDYIVRPGDLIATRQAATPGKPGRDIHGRLLPATPGKDMAIRAGDHVVISEDGREFRSAALGILRCESDDNDTVRLGVDPGLEVSADAMEAWLKLSVTSGDGTALALPDVLTSLHACGIKYGIDEAAINRVLQSHDAHGRPREKLLVARGKPPRDGVDAHIVYTQKEHIAGRELGKGRIDFHEHNFLRSFKNGEVIGQIIAAKAEENGVNVRGEIIEARPAGDMQLNLEGAHIDPRNRIVAELDGTLIINGAHLSLADLYVINCDVDQKTGNIHSVNDIHIKGHIEPGFAVESLKSIIIEKNIEGAKVRAGGNISIRGGIRGARSEVYTPGEISAEFIENADVFVNGDIIINGSIINSKVSSNHTITVGSRRSKHSTVIGGRITAHNRVEAVELGSSACRKTIISVGFTQEAKQQQRDFNQAIADKQVELSRLDQIETHHRLHPKADTNEVIRKINITRGAVTNAIKALNAQLDEIIQHIEQQEAGRVVVHKRIFPGVMILINDHVYEVERETSGGTFTLENDEVIFRPG
jgi:uncharacterized protein (DUF342 family)